MAEKLEYRSGTAIPGTKYKVIRILGVGGMGTVYEVEDTTIDKRYVLKTLHANLSTRTDLAERMQREAKALAKLEHKNIVQVITADVTKDALKLHYFVMEKLNGHTLRTVLDNKGSLEVDAGCRLAIDLLNALYHAHEHRIVHRDVKPENIFLHRDGDGVTVTKLLDFGVMTTADAVTMTGHRFIGTLRYAAPEQLLGNKVSPQTDLYAAGLVLYETICGCGPFDEYGDSMKVAEAHINAPPPPMSKWKVVPPALEKLVMSALSKEATERPADAFTFAAELNRVRRDLRSAKPISVSQQATAHDMMQVDETPATEPVLTPGEQPTAFDGHMRGATTPAGAAPGELPSTRREPGGHGGVGGDATEQRPGPSMARGNGYTLEDAGPPSDMSIGPAAIPAAGAGGIDRSAPTTTYVAPAVGTAAPPAGPGVRGGDTVKMDVVEHKNLTPSMEGAPMKTVRVEPIAEVFAPNATGSDAGNLPVFKMNTTISSVAGVPSGGPPWGIIVGVILVLAGLAAAAAITLTMRARQEQHDDQAEAARQRKELEEKVHRLEAMTAPTAVPAVVVSASASAPAASAAPAVSAPPPAVAETPVRAATTAPAVTTATTRPTPPKPSATATTRKMPGSGL